MGRNDCSMTEATLEKCAKTLVKRFINTTLDRAQYPNGITFDLHTVWKCYILGDMKFLITSDLPDGKYFEVTYSAEKQEFYLDAYVRIHNEAVSLFDFILRCILNDGEAPEHVTNDD